VNSTDSMGSRSAQVAKPRIIRMDSSNTNLFSLSILRLFHRLLRSVCSVSSRGLLSHTHATIMLKAGVHPKIVSERLGHATVGITLDTYSHVLPGLQEVAADKFDMMIADGVTEIERGNVSKPLAKQEEVESEPCRSRTCDHLIKSQGVSKYEGKEAKVPVLTP